MHAHELVGEEDILNYHDLQPVEGEEYVHEGEHEDHPQANVNPTRVHKNAREDHEREKSHRRRHWPGETPP